MEKLAFLLLLQYQQEGIAVPNNQTRPDEDTGLADAR